MQRLIILLVLLCFSTQLHSKTHYVIANSGLKLRKTPDTNGKVLDLAPFGSKVEVITIDTGVYGKVEYSPKAKRDTLGLLIPAKENQEAIYHIGYWWKVKYQGQVGYMFSGFLTDVIKLDDYPECNNLYRLKSVYGDAGSTSYPEFDLAWNWYGLFAKPDGAYNVKKVNIKYAVVENTDNEGHYSYYSRDMRTFIEDLEEPLYLIGTLETWKEHVGEGCYSYLSNSKEKQYFSYPDKTNPEFMAKYDIIVSDESKNVENNAYNSRDWFLTKGNKKQLIESPRTKKVNYSLSPNGLVWCGDIDGDGKKDYIFGYNATSGFLLLYLSSEAEKGEIANRVAVLWTWYTC
jgi:Bacterial SH3 domain